MISHTVIYSLRVQCVLLFVQKYRPLDPNPPPPPLRITVERYNEFEQGANMVIHLDFLEPPVLSTPKLELTKNRFYGSYFYGQTGSWLDFIGWRGENFFTID